MEHAKTKGKSEFIIAGTASSVGKTSISIGLTRALSNMGLRVQTYKVGPDFIDPTWLKNSSGSNCYNLDTWMHSEEYIREIYQKKKKEADICLIEGAMGLFDGSLSINTNKKLRQGSTASLAQLLSLAIVLVVDAKGMAQSFAATVKGYMSLEPKLRIVGVIANYCGSRRHGEILRECLRSYKLPELLGFFLRDSLGGLPKRHLGLHSFHPSSSNRKENLLFSKKIDQIEAICKEQIAIERLLNITREKKIKIPFFKIPTLRWEKLEKTNSEKKSKAKTISKFDKYPLRMGIAFDNAFSFYYPSNLEILEDFGFCLVPFSPVNDSILPVSHKLDCIYLGGGYPELYAKALSENISMHKSIQNFIKKGGLLYAECGGLCYLSHSLSVPMPMKEVPMKEVPMKEVPMKEVPMKEINSREESIEYPMLQLLPLKTRMLSKYKKLGYRETKFIKSTDTWGKKELKLRGHEFHYSEIMCSKEEEERILEKNGWSYLYKLRDTRQDTHTTNEGYFKGNILASYVHQSFASNPELIRNMRNACLKSH